MPVYVKYALAFFMDNFTRMSIYGQELISED